MLYLNDGTWSKELSAGSTLGNFTVTADGKKEFAPVGDGIVDFTSAFAQSKLAGLKYGFVEQDTCKITPEQCIKRSIDYLKKKNWGNG